MLKKSINPCGFKSINKNHIMIGPIKNKGFDINSLVLFLFGFTNIAIQKGPIQNVEIRKRYCINIHLYISKKYKIRLTSKSNSS